MEAKHYAVRFDAMWSLMPRLARSVGLGRVQSPARLARIEHVSRMSECGVAAQHGDQQGVHLLQQARARQRSRAGARRAAGHVRGRLQP